jgi:hypothetical protein
LSGGERREAKGVYEWGYLYDILLLGVMVMGGVLISTLSRGKSEEMRE